MTFVGIDPGEKSGAIAWLSETGAVLGCVKMPQTELDILEAIRGIGGPCVAALEGLNSMAPPRKVPIIGGGVKTLPGRGHQANWSMAWNSAAVLVSLHATGCVRIERPRPQEWQKFMGCMTRGDKNVSKRRAQELFPGVKVTLWNSDALLLAEYVRRTRGKG